MKKKRIEHSGAKKPKDKANHKKKSGKNNNQTDTSIASDKVEGLDLDDIADDDIDIYEEYEGIM